MYAIYKVNEETNRATLLAVHDSKKVVRKYCDDMYKSHKIRLITKNIDMDLLIDYPELSELYLIRYNDIYVQEKYYEYLKMSTAENIAYDHQYCLDVLSRIVLSNTLSEKKTKILIKAGEIINDLIDKEKNYVPTVEELNDIKMSYDAYRVNL